MRSIAVTFGLLVLPNFASAHHSLSEFDRGVQQVLEGEVLRAQWSNPHIRFTLRTENEAGEETIWELTGLDLNNLNRRNVPRDLVRVGDVIRVAGNPSKRHENQLYVSNLLAAGGTEIMISPTAEPLWSETVAGLVERPEGVAVAAGGEGATIFRVWSRAGPGGGVTDVRHFPVTPAAVAARSSWDPDDNFATRCEPEGMPRIMTNPHPFEFVDHGDTIALKSELYDLTRTIHMDNTADPAAQPATPLGFSVGHWEGGALVVKTSRVNWPYFDNIGTPQTEAAEYVERFTPSEGGRLDYDLTITDPGVFSEPATYRRHWLALGEALQAYNCRTY